MTTHDHLPDDLRTLFADLLLATADDKLVLGHRNSDWTGLAPILEEDIAFSSLAQDEIAHAQALYEAAGALLEVSADHLAFGREPEEYRCSSIVEVPDEFDWAVAICRQLFCDHFDRLRLGRLARSSFAAVAALAARLAAEEQVHVEHVNHWVVRLGRAVGPARERVQNALDVLAPLAPMLFEPIPEQERLEVAALYPPPDPRLGGGDDMFDEWSRGLTAVTDEAGLKLDLARPDPTVPGGRRGAATPHLAELLDEMSEVYRIEPGAAW